MGRPLTHQHLRPSDITASMAAKAQAHAWEAEAVGDDHLPPPQPGDCWAYRTEGRRSRRQRCDDLRGTRILCGHRKCGGDV